MLNILKKLTFWFVIFSLTVCFINLSGNDDKNILIYLTNPINPLLNDWLTKINTNPETTSFFRPLIYLFHLIFWGGVGLILDRVIMKLKRNR